MELPKHKVWWHEYHSRFHSDIKKTGLETQPIHHSFDYHQFDSWILIAHLCLLIITHVTSNISIQWDGQDEYSHTSTYAYSHRVIQKEQGNHNLEWSTPNYKRDEKRKVTEWIAYRYENKYTSPSIFGHRHSCDSQSTTQSLIQQKKMHPSLITSPTVEFCRLELLNTNVFL